MAPDSRKTYRQVVLLILDGWGYRKETEHNAIAEAHPEFFNYLWEHYPHCLIPASGEAVGLPKGNIGTSELGHTIIGAGTVIESDMVRINHAIANNTLKNNDALTKLFSYVKEHNSTLHFIGMVSPGGVHSHQDHLFALLAAAKEAGIKKIAVHAFTDGRDEPPRSAVTFITQLEEHLKKLGVGRIVSVSGRYYAMDRDNNWDRIQKAEDVLFEGKGEAYQGISAHEVVEKRYDKGETDEFITPSVLLDTEGSATIIEEYDGVLNFNFRPDREREISTKISEKVDSLHLCFVTMAQYDPKIHALVMFPPVIIKTTLAEQISQAGLTQVHVTETEKYAHLTYFLNGGVEKPHKNEEFVLIPSHKDVPTHDLAPHMRAEEIADRAIKEIEKGTNFIALNICNADMIGHTGNENAAIEGIKFTDIQIKRIVEALLNNGGVALITADHGNAEIMYDEKHHQPHTAHTLDEVPAIVTVGNATLLKEGSLADVAPTILQLFGLKKPVEMTGSSLIQ